MPVEVGNRPRDTRGQVLDVELRDATDAACPAARGLPERGAANAIRRDGADSGDDDAATLYGSIRGVFGHRRGVYQG